MLYTFFFQDSKVVSLASRSEMMFLTNNVDAKPVIYQIWIGLERQNTNGSFLIQLFIYLLYLIFSIL